MLTDFTYHRCLTDFVDTNYCPILISKYRNNHKKYLSEHGALRYFFTYQTSLPQASTR